MKHFSVNYSKKVYSYNSKYSFILLAAPAAEHLTQENDEQNENMYAIHPFRWRRSFFFIFKAQKTLWKFAMSVSLNPVECV